MLQWMGGSRRKVKTSKKSIQNRQHQYFEQRKRQQRTQGLEQNFENSENIAREIQQVRSLDVVSLMNICLAIHGNKENGDLQMKEPGLENELARDHLHATLNGDHLDLMGRSLKTEFQLTQNVCLKADAETQWTPSTAAEVVDTSRHIKGPVCTDFHESGQGEKLKESKKQSPKANHPPKKFSLLDMISDSSKESSQRSSPLEAYAAFPTEGIGKIKNESPDNFMPSQGKSSMPIRNPWASKNLASQSSLPKLRSESWNSEMLLQEHEKDNLDKDLVMSNFAGTFEGDLVNSKLKPLHADLNPELSRYISNTTHYMSSADESPNIEVPCLWDQLHLRTEKITMLNNSRMSKKNCSLQEAHFVHSKSSITFSEEISAIGGDQTDLNFSTMPTNAYSLTDETFLGWEDENQQIVILPDEYISTESPRENLNSFKVRGFQESPNMCWWDGSFQMEDSCKDILFSPTHSNIMCHNYLTTLCSPNKRYAISDISRTSARMTNSDWNNVPVCKELESERVERRFDQEEIETTSMNLSTGLCAVINKPDYNRIYQKASQRNIGEVAKILDQSSLSFSDPDFTMRFVTENGGNGWNAFSDESCSSSTVKSSWQTLGNLQRVSPNLGSFGSKRTRGINSVNIEGSEVNSYRTISTESKNLCQQKTRKIKERTAMEQFEICHSREKSKESQMSSSLEELSSMQEKTDAMPCQSSIMESDSKLDMKATADSLYAKLRTDKRAPQLPFNSTSNFDAPFEPNVATTSEPPGKRSRLCVLRQLESAQDGNESMPIPKSIFQGKETRKYLTIPRNALHGNFIDKKVSEKNLNSIVHRLQNYETADEVSSSMGEGKVQIHEQRDSLRTPIYNEISITSSKHNKGIELESSWNPANNLEDIQLTEPENNRDGFPHRETQLKERLNSSGERRELQACPENEQLSSCPEKQLNSKPEINTDSKRKVHTIRNNLAELSCMEVTDKKKKLQLEGENPQAETDNNADLEYQGMLESYILQLRCMHKALQETMDQELCRKKCSNE